MIMAAAANPTTSASLRFLSVRNRTPLFLTHVDPVAFQEPGGKYYAKTRDSDTEQYPREYNECDFFAREDVASTLHIVGIFSYRTAGVLGAA